MFEIIFFSYPQSAPPYENNYYPTQRFTNRAPTTLQYVNIPTTINPEPGFNDSIGSESYQNRISGGSQPLDFTDFSDYQNFYNFNLMPIYDSYNSYVYDPYYTEDNTFLVNNSYINGYGDVFITQRPPSRQGPRPKNLNNDNQVDQNQKVDFFNPRRQRKRPKTSICRDNNTVKACKSKKTFNVNENVEF